MKKKATAKKKAPAKKRVRTKRIYWMDTHRHGASYEWEEFACSGCKSSVFVSDMVPSPPQICPFCGGKGIGTE